MSSIVSTPDARGRAVLLGAARALKEQGRHEAAMVLEAVADGRNVAECRECTSLFSYPADFREGAKATQMCGSCYAQEML